MISLLQNERSAGIYPTYPPIGMLCISATLSSGQLFSASLASHRKTGGEEKSELLEKKRNNMERWISNVGNSQKMCNAPRVSGKPSNSEQ